MQSVSVALIDTNNLFRQGVKALFTDKGFQITKEASSLNAALAVLAEPDPPQLVLVDPVGLGEGAEVVQVLKAACPDVRLVLLTGKLDGNAMAKAIHAGADGFLMKDISIEGPNLVLAGLDAEQQAAYDALLQQLQQLTSSP